MEKKQTQKYFPATDYFTFHITFQSYDKVPTQSANDCARDIKERVDQINEDLHNEWITPKVALGYKQRIITIIEQGIQNAKNQIESGRNDGEETYTRRCRQLQIYKDAIKEAFGKPKDSKWKNAILGTETQSVFSTPLEKKENRSLVGIYCEPTLNQRVNQDAKEKISAKDKIRFPKTNVKNFCAVTNATSFAKEGGCSKKPVKNISHIANKDGNTLISVASGNSERAANIAAKHAVLLMSAHPTATSLLDGLYEETTYSSKAYISIVTAVQDEISARMDERPTYGSTPVKTNHQITLTCARAFSAEKNQFRLVGMNIGDNMVVAFDPKTRQFSTISHARQKEHDGSALTLSDSLQTKDITFDVLLPEGTLVFCLSKGVWEGLPLKQEKQKISYPSILTSEIDFNALSNDSAFHLPQNITPNNVVQALTNCAVSHIDLQRREKIAKAQQAKQKISQYTRANKIRHEGYYTQEVIDDDIKEEVKQLQRDFEFTVGDDFTIVCTQLGRQTGLQKQSTSNKHLISTNDSKSLKAPAIFFFAIAAIAAGLFVGFKALAPVEMYIAAKPFLLGIFAVSGLFTLILSAVAIAQNQKPSYEPITQTDEPKSTSEYVEGEAWDYDLPLEPEYQQAALNKEEDPDPSVSFNKVLEQPQAIIDPQSFLAVNLNKSAK